MTTVATQTQTTLNARDSTEFSMHTKCHARVDMGRIITKSNDDSLDITPFWKPAKKANERLILREDPAFSFSLPTLMDTVNDSSSHHHGNYSSSRPIAVASLCSKIMLPDVSFPKTSSPKFKLQPRKLSRRGLEDLSLYYVSKRPRSDAFVPLDPETSGDGESSSIDGSTVTSNKSMDVSSTSHSQDDVAICEKRPMDPLLAPTSSSLLSRPQVVRPLPKRAVFDPASNMTQSLQLMSKSSSVFLPTL